MICTSVLVDVALQKILRKCAYNMYKNSFIHAKTN